MASLPSASSGAHRSGSVPWRSWIFASGFLSSTVRRRGVPIQAGSTEHSQPFKLVQFEGSRSVRYPSELSDRTHRTPTWSLPAPHAPLRGHARRGKPASLDWPIQAGKSQVRDLMDAILEYSNPA